MHFFRASGSEPRVKMELSQMATAYRLAEAGFAATFLSDRLITSAESRLRFYRLPHPESQRTFHALTNPKRYRSEAVHQFLCSLQSQSRFSKRKKYASSSASWTSRPQSGHLPSTSCVSVQKLSQGVQYLPR